ncbi:MAG: hypothetical protein RLZZ234_889 [Candidatus Parcubacteria bacterium]|jgi:hypothetical protein
MGEVVPFKSSLALVPEPRILVLSDTKVSAEMRVHAFFYALHAIAGIVAETLKNVRGPTACVSCTVGQSTDAASVLTYFTKSRRIRIVGVVCLMKAPPRSDLARIFPGVQIFFEDPGHFAALARYVGVAR